MLSTIEYLGIGLFNTFEPLNALMILLGLVIGVLAGALPGITMLNAIVLVLPFTYLMDIVPSLLLMIGIYCGGIFGGSITGILFNIPGDPMNVPTTWEGYNLNKKGFVSKALGMSIMSLAMIMLGYLASSMTTDIRLLLTCFVFMGLGGAVFQSPNNTELMRSLPITKINIASSFTATIRNLGMALGVSLSGLLVSMQMAQSGYYGSISEASPLILASSISDVMMIAGGLCFMGATAAVYRGMRSE